MTSEGVKGGCHALMDGLALAMALYSVLRLTEEKTHRTHLWINLGVYSGLVIFELVQTRRHWSAPS